MSNSRKQTQNVTITRGKRIWWSLICLTHTQAKLNKKKPQQEQTAATPNETHRHSKYPAIVPDRIVKWKIGMNEESVIHMKMPKIWWCIEFNGIEIVGQREYAENNKRFTENTKRVNMCAKKRETNKLFYFFSLFLFIQNRTMLAKPKSQWCGCYRKKNGKSKRER